MNIARIMNSRQNFNESNILAEHRIKNNTNGSRDNFTSKEQHLEATLEYAKNIIREGSIVSTKTWIKECLHARDFNTNTNTNTNNGHKHIYELARNERTYFTCLSKMFPRGFQKALAIGFIMENGLDAFNENGSFNMAKFRGEIESSGLPKDDIRNVLENLEAKNFEHIGLNREKTEVIFGNTEYTNTLPLPLGKCKDLEATLDYAKKIIKGGSIVSTKTWIKECLNLKTSSSTIANSHFYELAQTKGSCVTCVSNKFPRGFQKALAIGFIMEKNLGAFKTDGSFDFVKFKAEIGRSDLSQKEKDNVLDNLEVKSFERISLNKDTLEVIFGNVEYTNTLTLSFGKCIDNIVEEEINKYIRKLNNDLKDIKDGSSIKHQTALERVVSSFRSGALIGVRIDSDAGVSSNDTLEKAAKNLAKFTKIEVKIPEGDSMESSEYIFVGVNPDNTKVELSQYNDIINYSVQTFAFKKVSTTINRWIEDGGEQPNNVSDFFGEAYFCSAVTWFDYGRAQMESSHGLVNPYFRKSLENKIREAFSYTDSSDAQKKSRSQHESLQLIW